MAKGLRASVKKNNRTKLRSKVFGPVVDARTERLSQKLLALAEQPRPSKTEMEVDPAKEIAGEQPTTEEERPQAEAMDVDGAAQNESAPKRSSTSRREKAGKVQKRRHRKASNEISFPKYDRNARKGKLGRKGK
ncbi:hypothetical protein EJ08DRAFT_653501 [Tothia fuscella]|uniref:DUF2423 domain-containing protein n=1 Tax=Tothia fuscella TaxID=1048955 RepID=A0A9P4TTX8_9PEZI|nr:hypothetical protein EJ08DRAFT_653501 [Tothia fuscella]